MLICEYKCDACGWEFEVMRRIDEEGPVACPRCESFSVTNTVTIAASCSGTPTSSSGNVPGSKP